MNNTIMDKINGRPYGLRILYAALGLFIFAFGVYLTIQANVGLAPWDAFSMGVSYHVPLTYGDIVTLTGFVILAIDLLLKEKIGLGSILDVCIVGKSVDLFTWLDIVPQLHNIWIGIPFVIEGKQVFLPFIGYLLSKENERELAPVHLISFLTQKMLLMAIYERWIEIKVSDAAKRLGVSTKSASRCFDELGSR